MGSVRNHTESCCLDRGVFFFTLVIDSRVVVLFNVFANTYIRYMVMKSWPLTGIDSRLTAHQTSIKALDCISLPIIHIVFESQLLFQCPEES